METVHSSYLQREYTTDPNRRNFRIMHIMLVVILSFWIFNECGIFYVEPARMRTGGGLILIFSLIPLFLALQKGWEDKNYMKYVFVSSSVLTAFVCVFLFSFYGELFAVLPFLVVLQYRDLRLSKTVQWIVCLFIVFVPVFSFLAGLWDYDYLSWLVSYSGAAVTASVPVSADIPPASIANILIDYSLPRSLMILCIGSAVNGVVDRGQRLAVQRSTMLEKEKRVESMQENMLTNMAIVIEDRGGGTGAHVYNVKNYVRLIVEYILENGLYPETVTREYATMLINASVIHDVGKVSVPDEILHIKGKYTPEQYKVMQSHAIMGEQIVLNTFGKNMTAEEIQLLRDICGTHHERWDGTGYPRGLRGDAIPLAGRIMAVADVFDALISMRVYKESMTVDQAFDVLVQDSGTHFDKSIVGIFLSQRPRVEEIVERSRRNEYNR